MQNFSEIPSLSSEGTYEVILEGIAAERVCGIRGGREEIRGENLARAS